ncbi:MAG: histidine kinase [Capnocytophaga sp.]|nr:histidine kinase [Capnocytophaga sp.]
MTSLPHLIAWVAVLVIPLIIFLSEGRNGTSDTIIRTVIQFPFLLLLFYINYLWIIDRLLFKRKYTAFFLLNIFLILLFSNIKYSLLFGEYFTPNLRRPPPPQGFVYFDFLTNLLPVVFAIAIKYAQQMFRLQLEQQEAQNVHLKVELQQLKYQLQPHFFFNSLNNIYSMIAFAPDKAQQSIHSLSKLMRHFLQSSEAESIPLSEEIDFLNQYIELMSLRLTDKTRITTDFPTAIPPLSIAPLLLISLVENAFKHGVSATDTTKIHFSLKISEKTIIFVSENTLLTKKNDDLYSSGIGVENLQKRLQLLYPDKNKYQITKENGLYKATISITTD